MCVFMAKQIDATYACSPIGKVFRTVAVFAGLMMFQANTAYFVAQQQQKVIVVIMMRAIKLVCFQGKLLMCRKFVRGERSMRLKLTPP